MNAGDQIPLKAYTNIAAFKLYFVDVGLFRRMAKISYEIIQNKEKIFDVFNGLLTEQFVLQQLYKYELFYRTGTQDSEIDFITQIDGRIIPIEVKS